MKPFFALSAAGLLLLCACSPENTETPVPVGTKPSTQNESSEVAGGEKPSAFDQGIADPTIAAGEEIYERSCAGCHESGTGGAPKPGEKADWKDRIGLGVEALTKRSIEGYEGKKGAMPAKGGNAELSDEEVSKAVQYMIARTK
jgi:cytochrome c5